MALQKQSFPINFAQGVNTKVDPKQLSLGQFTELENTIFSKAGMLQKRNGFGRLGPLPDSTNSYLTTYNGNLTAIGSTLNAYSSGPASWASKGVLKPIDLRASALIRSSTNQTFADTALSSNGLVCTVYTDSVPVAGSPVAQYKYTVSDVNTGQNVLGPTAIPVASGSIAGSPRVFSLGQYFVIVLTVNHSGTYHLEYVSISTAMPVAPTTSTDLSIAYTPATTVAFDGVVANNNLYLAWNGNDGGGAIRMTYLDSTLTQHGTVTFAGYVATFMSICADTSGSTAEIYAAFYSPSNGYVIGVDHQLTTVLGPTKVIDAASCMNITCVATAGVCTVISTADQAYSYDSGIKTNFMRSRTCTRAGVVGTQTTFQRSLGLASKAFIMDGVIYVLGAYNSTNQPSYFLVSTAGNIVGKLAYSNGGGYPTTGLPSVTIQGSTASVAYRIKDLIEPVNKSNGASVSSAVYSQTGINLAQFDFTTDVLTSAEIGDNLHLSGGQLWMYDGLKPVEHGFHVWPDYVEVTTSAAGGSIAEQDYYYSAVYEWTDGAGNIHRSAPSIPVLIATTGATSTNTIYVPTLRLTAKTTTPVKICLYRWSEANPIFYQVTSISNPVLNDTTTDSVTITDTSADSSIIGNSILYTTGGVVENIGAPAAKAVALYRGRAVLIPAENRNSLWYSKQVIQGVPAEFSDLFTLYVSPTVGAQGDTGEMACLSAMDDKLILFKRDAIYYEVGTGPDNTGANNDFSEPVFITSTVGCINQNSVVFIPNGLMFESDKGIWLLGRDLSTSYIGADVESFTEGGEGIRVRSAVCVPGTNQVRFTLDTGFTLMYDYFYNQWGVFAGIPGVSSTLFENLHTFINDDGLVYQEAPGTYIDGSRAVCLKFATGWVSLAGIQGYERAYMFYLLGEYLSPHKLTVSIAFDFNDSPEQVIVIEPDNFSGAYGDDPIYGNNSYGGFPSLEQWQVFFQKQKVQAFKITVQESFDASFGTEPGAGLTLSGLDLVVGLKKGYPAIKAAASVG